MKFTSEHLNSLKQAIEASNVDLKATAEHYKEKGYSETRFLWDIFWASKWSENNRDVPYLDTHITTALRNAVNELGVKY